jgi:hypothetical protein
VNGVILGNKVDESQKVFRYPHAMGDVYGEGFFPHLDGVQHVYIPCFQIVVFDAETQNVIGLFAFGIRVALDVEKLSALNGVEEIDECFP